VRFVTDGHAHPQEGLEGVKVKRWKSEHFGVENDLRHPHAKLILRIEKCCPALLDNQTSYNGPELTASVEERRITLSDRVYQRLMRAKGEGESIDDVIMRLTSTKLFGLQRRGEVEILTSDDKALSVSVDQDLCMGAESCVGIAPEVFSLDESQLGRRTSSEPLGMLDVEERTVDSDKIIRAGKSCPYRAIRIRDAKTNDQLCPR
jgi:ferredoxin/predicted CopG family antitoxin